MRRYGTSLRTANAQSTQTVGFISLLLLTRASRRASYAKHQKAGYVANEYSRPASLFAEASGEYSLFASIIPKPGRAYSLGTFALPESGSEYSPEISWTLKVPGEYSPGTFATPEVGREYFPDS